MLSVTVLKGTVKLFRASRGPGLRLAAGRQAHGDGW
jgi:hypothetical protein